MLRFFNTKRMLRSRGIISPSIAGWYTCDMRHRTRPQRTAAGIEPRQWSGAGWLAAALLEKYGVPKRPLTSDEIAANPKNSRAKIQNPRRCDGPSEIWNSR